MTKMMQMAGISALVLLGVAACAQSEPVERLAGEYETQPSIKLPVPATIKPGAGLRVEHELRVNAGDPLRGTVDLEAFEGYPAGELVVEAVSTDEALALFGPAVTQRFDMADTDRHTWTVNYEAETDGRYMISVMLTAEPELGIPMVGSHAVRLEAGDMNKVVAAPAAKTEIQPDGETVIIMDAEETIEW